MAQPNVFRQTSLKPYMHFVVRVMLILTSCPYSEAVPIGIATQQLIPDPLESASIFHRTSPIANGSGIRTKVEANPILTRPVLLGTKSYCTLVLIPDPIIHLPVYMDSNAYLLDQGSVLAHSTKTARRRFDVLQPEVVPLNHYFKSYLVFHVKG